MRAAQQKESDLVFDDLLFKISKVYLVSSCFLIQYQITGYQPAPIVQNHLTERVVDRLLDQHRLPGHGAGPDGNRYGKDDARRFLQPCRFHLPAVVGQHPALYSVKIGII